MLEKSMSTSQNAGTVTFLSINPDLKELAGHFPLYEARLSEICDEFGVEYLCAGRKTAEETFKNTTGVFEKDSGHYSLMRASARGNESEIVSEFHARLIDVFKTIDRFEGKKIVMFLYCGSSKLAAELVNFEFPANVALIINGFWDFLDKDTIRSSKSLSRLKFRPQIIQWAMSDLEARFIEKLNGLRFRPIRNPNPLHADSDAFRLLHENYQRRNLRLSAQRRKRVLFPGLGSAGKGFAQTEAFFASVDRSWLAGYDWIVRDHEDRIKAIIERRGIDPDSIEVLSGYQTSEALSRAYSTSDLVIVPYEVSAFQRRTSGVLTDAYVFQCVPLVRKGTWLASIAERFDAGIVAESFEPLKLAAQIDWAVENLGALRGKLATGATAYFETHSWSGLLGDLLEDGLNALSVMADTDADLELRTKPVQAKKSNLDLAALGLASSTGNQPAVPAVNSERVAEGRTPAKSVARTTPTNVAQQTADAKPTAQTGDADLMFYAHGHTLNRPEVRDRAFAWASIKLTEQDYLTDRHPGYFWIFKNHKGAGKFEARFELEGAEAGAWIVRIARHGRGAFEAKLETISLDSNKAGFTVSHEFEHDHDLLRAELRPSLKALSDDVAKVTIHHVKLYALDT